MSGRGAGGIAAVFFIAKRALSWASVCCAALLLASLGTCTVASATGTPAPDLTIHALSTPTYFSQSANAECEATSGVLCDSYQVTVTNTGSQPATGPIAITDALPSHLQEAKVRFELVDEATEEKNVSGDCEAEAVSVKCDYPLALEPGQALQLDIFVTVGPGAVSGEANVAKVFAEGSSKAAGHARSLDTIDSGSPSFGPNYFLADIAGSNGTAETQAGGHPYALSTRIDMNAAIRETAAETRFGVLGDTTVQDVRDVFFDLPLGFVGTARATPQCTFAQLGSAAGCPADTQVGYIRTEPAYENASVQSPMYNMIPEYGYPAEFGFVDLLHGTHALSASIVPTPAGYVLRVSIRELSQILLESMSVVFYGDPAARDRAREQDTPYATNAADVPLFTNPADCAGEPLETTLHMDSWQHPGSYNADGSPDLADPNWVSVSSESPPVTGCGALQFHPTLAIAPEPEHARADEPAGYEVDLRVPQSEGTEELATPPLQTAVLTLPAGVSISPGVGSGLAGCQETGPEGLEPESSAPGHCPAESTVGEAEVATPLLPAACGGAGQAGCRPGESPAPLQGRIYLAQPTCGGAGQPACTEAAAETGGVFALYVEASSVASGVHLKLKGSVEVGGEGREGGHHNDLAPGQVRVTIAQAPQLPLSELKLHFYGGPRALLANPQTCGTFTTTAELEPWSHEPAPGEAQGTPDVTLEPAFEIAGGCGGGFAPALSAGTVTPRAGAYSPLTVTFSRQDGEQDLAGARITLPPGLLGKVAGVPECPEAAASEGTCGSVASGSRIGTVNVASGAGSEPAWQAGSIYLTGPTSLQAIGASAAASAASNVAPFGLSIVVPASIGPFNLGNVVVRAAIEIDPNTAQMTIVTGPLPQMVDGVPLRLKTVSLAIERAGFIFSPTDCDHLAVTGTVSGVAASGGQGATAAVSSPFAAQGCKQLAFKPKLTVSTSGKTSIEGGASLKVKLTMPAASTAGAGAAGSAVTGSPSSSATGGEANLAKLKIDLPAHLPSRLSTLQQACRVRTFEANPAACPAASKVGYAVVNTPVFPVPLTGPAIFISHGDEAFPSMILELQGDGVRIELVGETNVESGVSSTTFQTLPDVPIDTLELTLGEGPYSALDANGNLCSLKKTVTVHRRIALERDGRRLRRGGRLVYVTRKVKETQSATLAMPTAFVAQNGAQLKQTTQVAITGCPASRKARRR
jgi:hypothetical protein